MDLETLFSTAGAISMVGWLLLVVSPFMPTWSDRIAGLIIPVILSLGYAVLSFVFAPSPEGGFGSLADVAKLFSQQESLLAGWIHFLAFDLFVGAWICRTARNEGIRFWLVLPCLPLTFLFGPAGYLAFLLVRCIPIQSSS